MHQLFSWLTCSRSQSDADKIENSLDISFEFFAGSPGAEAELTKVEYEVKVKLIFFSRFFVSLKGIAINLFSFYI